MNSLPRFIITILVSLLALFSCFSQDRPQESSIFNDLTTPYGAVVTHLGNLQSNSYYPQVAAGAFHAEGLPSKQKIILAIRLKQIYDGLGHYIDVEAIPQNPNYRDSTHNNAHHYRIVNSLSQIYLTKQGNEWKYSPATVKQIDKIYKSVYPFGSHRILDFVNAMGLDSKGKTFIDLYMWQWLGLVVLLVMSFVS